MQSENPVSAATWITKSGRTREERLPLVKVDSLLQRVKGHKKGICGCMSENPNLAMYKYNGGFSNSKVLVSKGSREMEDRSRGVIWKLTFGK